MKVIDLSATIAPTPEGTPEFARIDIEYRSHEEGARQAEALLTVPANFFRNEEGWATETIKQLETHGTTHVDAPYHYNSIIQDKKSATIDEISLEWFYGDGVVVDMCHKRDGEVVGVEDIKTFLSEHDIIITPGVIVLIKTGRDKYYNASDYIFKGCGVSQEATVWLWEQGVRVMGIDAWGWDAPLNMQALQAVQSDDSRDFWSAHQCNLPYCHIERLVNLASLPASGFKISCFPLKIKGASAGPARVVAILDD